MRMATKALPFAKALVSKVKRLLLVFRFTQVDSLDSTAFLSKVYIQQSVEQCAGQNENENKNTRTQFMAMATVTEAQTKAGDQSAHFDMRYCTQSKVINVCVG